jgi:hypothetical protein
MITRVPYIAEREPENSLLPCFTESGRILALVAVTLFGCLIVFLLVFDVALLKSFGFVPGSLQHPWQGWELAALLWTFTFALVYFFDFPYVRDRPKVNKLISLLSLLPVILTVPAAYFLLANRYLLHFCFVLALGVLLFLTDNLLYRLHDDPEIKLQYLESTMLADFPMVVALCALGIYLWSYGQVATENSEVFLAGAIAFQLVASNAIFVLIQSRIIHKARTRLTHTLQTKKITDSAA